MKTIEKVTFISNSNNRNTLKALTEKENAKLEQMFDIAKSNGLKYFAICFTVKGFNDVYAFKIPIEEAKKRMKTNEQKNGKYMFKIFCPLSLAQMVELIKTNKCSVIGSLDDLEKAKEKHNCKNNGQAVEYLVKRYEHKAVNHTQKLLDGGDALNGNTEIKYFELGFGTSPSCRLFENIK